MKRITRLVALALLLLIMLACEQRITYHSIWADVYYTRPPYQAELEELEVE